MQTSFFRDFATRPSPRLRLEIDRIIARFRFGIHRSAMTGRGIEFRGFKPYEPSDPPNTIDYFASERISQEPDFEPVTRQFNPEREIGVVFLLSVSESMSVPLKKLSCALEILWLFALSAFKPRDRFRIILFGEHPLYDSGWALSEDQIKEFFADLERKEVPASYRSKDADVFSYLASFSLLDTMVVVVSDFSSSWGRELRSLRQLGIFENNIRVVMLALDEWLEFRTSSHGLTLKDPNSGVYRYYSPKEVAELAAEAQRRSAEIRQKVRPLAVPFIEVSLFQDAVCTVERAFLRMG